MSRRKRRRWSGKYRVLFNRFKSWNDGSHRRVEIPFEVYAKIMHWVRVARTYEVSGFGKVERLGNHFRIVDAILVRQVNTIAGTTLNAHALNAAEHAMKDVPGHFNFWWHSHHHMSAFFSPTDDETIYDLGREGWILAIVFNARGQHEIALYERDSFPHLTKDLPLCITGDISEETIDDWNTTYTNLVTEFDYKDVVKLTAPTAEVVEVAHG